MKAKAEKEGEEGMLEYLDDIIGTSRFCKPIKLFSLKLELVGIERESQMNKLNIVEIDLQNLAEPVRELLELLVLENKISALKNKLFCLKRVEYSKKLEETQPKIDEAKAAVDEKEKELDKLMAKLKEQKKPITEQQKEADKHNQLIADTEKQLKDVNQNQLDHRFIEYHVDAISDGQVKFINATLTECSSRLNLNSNKDLIIDDDKRVSLVYFRSSYSPSNYPTDKEWDARLTMERSTTIKCPWIGLHLAVDNVLIRAFRPPLVNKVVSELGTYGFVFGNSTKVLRVHSHGHISRSKAEDVNEGGVAVRAAAIDSVYLF